MKITDITYDCVQVPFPEEFHPTWYPGKTEQGQVIFVVRVHTDEGITAGLRNDGLCERDDNRRLPL